MRPASFPYSKAAILFTIGIVALFFFATQQSLKRQNERHRFVNILPENIHLLIWEKMKSLKMNRNPGLIMKRRIARQQTVDSTLKYLVSLNLNSFKNRPVDSLIAKIPLGYLRMKIYGGDNPQIARRLIITYPYNVFVKVMVSNFQYMNPRSEDRNWNMALFRKESIDFIEIYSDKFCVKGCP